MKTFFPKAAKPISSSNEIPWLAVKQSCRAECQKKVTRIVLATYAVCFGDTLLNDGRSNEYRGQLIRNCLDMETNKSTWIHGERKIEETISN